MNLDPERVTDEQVSTDVPSSEAVGPTDAARATGAGGRRGRATRRGRRDEPCLNCGDPTPGDYCPTCGQRKVDVQASVRSIVMDELEDEFLVDRRLPRSLKGLFFKPGFLTAEYVNGRIARYVRPLKLYIVSSLLFFLTVSFFSSRMIEGVQFGPPDADGNVMTVGEIDSALVEMRRGLVEPTLPPETRQALEVADSALTVERDRLAQGAEADTSGGVTPPSANERRTVADMIDIGDGPSANATLTGIAAVDSAMVRRVRMIGEMTPRQAVDRLASDFINYVPSMMFLLLPVFALVLKLLYIRRRRFYAEHFIFLLHVHSFVYLIFTTMLLVRGVLSLPAWLFLVLLGWTSIYIYLAMKRVYRQGWVKTFIKYIGLGWAYMFILFTSIPLGFIIAVLLL